MARLLILAGPLCVTGGALALQSGDSDVPTSSSGVECPDGKFSSTAIDYAAGAGVSTPESALSEGLRQFSRLSPEQLAEVESEHGRRYAYREDGRTKAVFHVSQGSGGWVVGSVDMCAADNSRFGKPPGG